MNRKLLQRFLNGEIAVALKAPIRWTQFLELLEKETDVIWDLGRTPTDNEDGWWINTFETAIAFGCVKQNRLGFDCCDFYEMKGYEIVKYEDFIKEEGEKNMYLTKVVFRSGEFFCEYATSPYEVISIQYNNPYTTVIFKDRSVVVVKCSDDSEYDEYSGFCVAITKKVFGSNAEIKRVIEQKSKDIKRKHHV